MACIPGVNPSKTLGIISSSSSSNSIQNSLSFSSPAQINFKSAQISQRLPKISIVMATKQQEEHEASLNALTSSDRRDEVMIAAKNSLSNCLSETNLHLTIPALKSKTRGKVRDIYDGGDYLVLVTTDRQSAFDRVLASIPFKGQVLNDTSLWWFNQTQHIAPNAIVAVPDQNVTIAKKCSVFPVEFVGKRRHINTLEFMLTFCALPNGNIRLLLENSTSLNPFRDRNICPFKGLECNNND